jgi:hypothetical protein
LNAEGKKEVSIEVEWRTEQQGGQGMQRIWDSILGAPFLFFEEAKLDGKKKMICPGILY